MWNLTLKSDAYELICKTETNLQILKTNLWLSRGEHGERNKSGAWEDHTFTTIYKTDEKQGPTV